MLMTPDFFITLPLGNDLKEFLHLRVYALLHLNTFLEAWEASKNFGTCVTGKVVYLLS